LIININNISKLVSWTLDLTGKLDKIKKVESIQEIYKEANQTKMLNNIKLKSN
jgi:hypothetical protein